MSGYRYEPEGGVYWVVSSEGARLAGPFSNDLIAKRWAESNEELIAQEIRKLEARSEGDGGETRSG